MSHIVKAEKTGKILSLDALVQACADLGTVGLRLASTPGGAKFRYYEGEMKEGADAVIFANGVGLNRLGVSSDTQLYELGIMRNQEDKVPSWSIEGDPYNNIGGLGELVGRWDEGMPKLMQRYRIARDMEIARNSGDNFVRLRDGSMLVGSRLELEQAGFPVDVDLNEGDIVYQVTPLQLYAEV